MCLDMTLKIIFGFHTNKTRCNTKGFALGFILKLRVSGFGKNLRLRCLWLNPYMTIFKDNNLSKLS